MGSANIQFFQIPGSIRKPGKYFEFNTALAVNTLPQNPYTVLLIGQRLATGSVAAGVITQVFSDADAATFYGAGSMLHLMVRAAITANPYLQLFCIAVDDSAATPQAALGTITVTGTATASGDIQVWIANVMVDVGIGSGDTASVIAGNIDAALDAYPDLPVTAAAVGDVITFTAKNKGTIANQIGLQAIVSNAGGVTASVAPMAGGSVDPTITAALGAAYAYAYNIYVCPYNDAASLEALRTQLEGVSGPLEQRGAIGVAAVTGALSAATTLATAIDDGRTVLAYLPGTASASYEIASALAAVMAFAEDPAMPFDDVALTGIAAPPIAARLGRTEQETLLWNGVTPLEVGPGEIVQIVRAISTYTVDAQGVADPALLDITTIRTLDYVRLACRQRIALRFPRTKITSKLPARVKSELFDVLNSMELLEIVQNVMANKDGLIVEQDLQDSTRLDAKIPANVVSGLHIFAGRIDLIL